MTRTYFFDSYAVIEILNSNPAYKDYSLYTPFFTKLNVYEVYYYLLRKHNESIANKFAMQYSNYVKEFNIFTVINAAKFKLLHKNKKLSMTDCIGYTMARGMGIPFLTGDKEFEGLPNVEFVK